MSALDLLRAPARQSSSLDEIAHRPWPLPPRSWIMGQSWEDLLFAHWRVDVEALRRLVPPALTVEEPDGSAWLGVTPFVLTGFRLRGTLPLPIVSSFAELNVRTYVTVDDRPGIWFFSLDTPSRLAVEGARRAYKLPYNLARATAEKRGDTVAYSCRRSSDPRRQFEGRYAPTGETFNAEPDSLEWFLAERYCLYAVDKGKL